MADAGMTPAQFEKIKAFAIGFAAKVVEKYPGFKVSIVEFGPVEGGNDGDFWFRLIDLDTGMTEFYFANIHHDDDGRVSDALTKNGLNRDKYNPEDDLMKIYSEAFPAELLDETTAINMVKDNALEKQEAGSAFYQEFTTHTPKTAASASAVKVKGKDLKPTLKAQTSFQIGQGLKYVHSDRPFIFPENVACDNGSDATAIKQVIDGYNSIDEMIDDTWEEVANGYYAPKREEKIPLAQMYELHSHAKKPEELTRPPNDFLKTGMMGFITSSKKKTICYYYKRV
jgi:hypothetical protein